MIKKLMKAIAIFVRPSLWRPLLHGTAASIEHIKALRQVKMGTCLDVGANVGQFSILVRYMFPSATIIAFEPLSEAADRFAECERPVFMKIDVQGSELDVLKGCGDALPFIDWIYVEVSYVTLYSGQPLAGDIVRYLAERRFTLRGIFNQVETKAYGATQADFLFSR